MGSRGRKSGRGGASGKGPHHVTVTKQEIEARITKEMKRVPSPLRSLLAKHDVHPKVVTFDEAKRIMPSITGRTRGFLNPSSDPNKRGAFVIIDRFQHRRGAKNAGMTALHEHGHALDQLKGKVGELLSSSKAFKAAMRKDRQQQKKLKFSAEKLNNLNYTHYKRANRPRELVAEGFATIYGSGRPANVQGANKTADFKKAWPNVIDFLKAAFQ